MLNLHCPVAPDNQRGEMDRQTVPACSALSPTWTFACRALYGLIIHCPQAHCPLSPLFTVHRHIVHFLLYSLSTGTVSTFSSIHCSQAQCPLFPLFTVHRHNVRILLYSLSTGTMSTFSSIHCPQAQCPLCPLRPTGMTTVRECIFYADYFSETFCTLESPVHPNITIRSLIFRVNISLSFSVFSNSRNTFHPLSTNIEFKEFLNRV